MTWFGRHRIDLTECGSTNDEAGRLARAGASHGTILIAHSQRAGRGRNGRVWASPPGAGLYLSAIVRPPLALELVPPMTLAIGVGLCDAIRACGVEAELKWPNDVLVGDRKLAGVLVESQSHGSRLEAVIVGIGVNLSGSLPPELAAITLAEARTRLREDLPELSRDAVVAHVCEHVGRWIDRYVAIGLPSVVPAWQERMALGLAARATVEGDGSAVVGELAGLDRDGALLLRDASGQVHRVRSGDVEVIRPTRGGVGASIEALATPC